MAVAAHRCRGLEAAEAAATRRLRPPPAAWWLHDYSAWSGLDVRQWGWLPPGSGGGSTPPPPDPTGDFNLDGKPDLLFNSVNGQLAAWYMNGSQRIGASYLLSSAQITNSYHVTATSDLNGDGKANLLLQDDLTGAVTVYFMDGLQKIGERSIALKDGSPWRIVATGDLNGDGYADIVWQNPTAGFGLRVVHEAGQRAASVHRGERGLSRRLPEERPSISSVSPRRSSALVTRTGTARPISSCRTIQPALESGT